MDFNNLGISRSALMKTMFDAGIGTQVHYVPLHLQPFFRKASQTTEGDFPITESYYNKCLSLPIHHGIDNSDVERVINALASILNKNK